MTYKRDGDRITLEMGSKDYAMLLMALGLAAGTLHRDGNVPMFYRLMDFANRMNSGNPDYTPYQIPPEFSSSKEKS